MSLWLTACLEVLFGECCGNHDRDVAPSPEQSPKLSAVSYRKRSTFDSDVFDFDREARKLLEATNLKSFNGMSSKYKDLNAIYRRKGGGIIYVGNEKASKTHKILKDNGIKGIINCTQGEYTLENHFPRQINY